MSKKSVPTECPYCAVVMRPTAMECPVCDVEVQGRFRQDLFQLLDEEERKLLEAYLMAGFSIKALARTTGMGYAAIRTRLDRLIEHFGKLRVRENEKQAILDQVASGAVTAAEAAQRIANLRAD
jgi:hypothetical protein